VHASDLVSVRASNQTSTQDGPAIKRSGEQPSMFSIVQASRKGGGKTTLASPPLRRSRARRLRPLGGRHRSWPQWADCLAAGTPGKRRPSPLLCRRWAPCELGRFQTVFIDTPPSIGAEVTRRCRSAPRSPGPLLSLTWRSCHASRHPSRPSPVRSSGAPTAWCL
jgi:hypothetical protein